jgi:hypothetical protein
MDGHYLPIMHSLQALCEETSLILLAEISIIANTSLK